MALQEYSKIIRKIQLEQISEHTFLNKFHQKKYK
jgi:hypothetical protein